MVWVFQLKTNISFKGFNCLHWGHLILAIRKNNQQLKKVQSKPRIIPKRRVISKVDIDFLFKGFIFRNLPILAEAPN
jgi:hypothetical protein